MKAKALSMFRTKLRHDDEGTVLVTIGQVIEGDDEHLRELARNRLVELVEDSDELAGKPDAADKPAKGKAMTGKAGSAPEGGEGKKQ